MTPIYCPDSTTALKIVNALECLDIETKRSHDHYIIVEELGGESQ